MWEVDTVYEYHFTGERKVKNRNIEIEIDDTLPFSIEIKPFYFHDKSPLPEVYEMTSRVLALEFSTTLPVEEFSNNEFVNQSKSVADELILLVSFMSRSWIIWYMYNAITSEYRMKHVRRTRGIINTRYSRHDTLIKHGNGREFLKTAFSNMKKLRSEGIEISLPISYYLSGLGAKYTEQQFTDLFLSLECVKDLHAQCNADFRSNIDPDSFKLLTESIKKIVHTEVSDQESRRRIYNKLNELNRPALKTVLDKLLSLYNLSYDDLYPCNQDISLIKTRDDLFHSSNKPDHDHLIRELYRLRSLIERVLLSMLGWSDHSNSPDGWTKNLIQK
jgi:hypothetical protein